MIKFENGEAIEMSADEIAELQAWRDGYESVSNLSYRLYKSVFIRRLTPDEAAVMEVVLANAPAKLRMLFNSVEYFVSDDELFGDLRSAVSTALGTTRASELLVEG